MDKFDPNHNWHVDVLRHPAMFGFQLRIARMIEDGKKCEMASLRVQTFDTPQGYAVGDAVHEGSTNLNGEQIQAVMDQLWNMGFRPSNGEGNAGELGATRVHLKDMRALVANKLKVGLTDV